MNAYLGDSIALGRVTLDLGVRYDQQSGQALAAVNKPNSAFSALVPGINFSGYDAPFTWKNISPRVGMTYALSSDGKTLLRASFSRNAGQLTAVGTYVGYANPSSAAGFVEYPWVDANGDHLAQSGEVRVDLPLIASGNGFNTSNPTSVTSANRINPDFKAPTNMGFILGFDRELMPDLGLSVNYTQTRVTNHPMFPFIDVTTADWEAIAPLVGTTSDGVAYNIPLFQPNAAKVAANGGGRFLTNFDDYATTFQGVEMSLTKRMSSRWMARVAGAWNNPQEHYDMAVAVNETGNPTVSDTFPLQDGGQWAPRSAGSGSGDVFINQRWNFNLNGAYQAAWGIELAGNLFGKQGTPYPYYRNAALGREGSIRILLNPELDTNRFDTLWNLDLRASKNFRFGSRGSVQLIADLFNVMNSATEITRERNAAATTFRVLGSNLSPRILRFGARLNF